MVFRRRKFEKWVIIKGRENIFNSGGLLIIANLLTIFEDFEWRMIKFMVI